MTKMIIKQIINDIKETWRFSGFLLSLSKRQGSFVSLIFVLKGISKLILTKSDINDNNNNGNFIVFFNVQL